MPGRKRTASVVLGVHLSQCRVASDPHREWPTTANAGRASAERSRARTEAARRSRANRLFPEDDLVVAAGYEGDSAVLGDDDGEACRVIVGGAVASAHVFDVFGLACLPPGVECSPDIAWGGKLSGRFGTKAEHAEAFVE